MCIQVCHGPCFRGEEYFEEAILFFERVGIFLEANWWKINNNNTIRMLRDKKTSWGIIAYKTIYSLVIIIFHSFISRIKVDYSLNAK